MTQLSLALTDGDPDVRSAAVSALTEIGNTEAVRGLAAALSDPDPRIWEEAVDSLSEIGRARVVTLLELQISRDLISTEV